MPYCTTYAFYVLITKVIKDRDVIVLSPISFILLLPSLLSTQNMYRSTKLRRGIGIPSVDGCMIDRSTNRAAPSAYGKNRPTVRNISIKILTHNSHFCANGHKVFSPSRVCNFLYNTYYLPRLAGSRICYSLA